MRRSLELTREGLAPPFRGPRRPSERAAKATCGGPNTSRPHRPRPIQGTLKSLFLSSPRAAPGPALQCAGKVRGVGEVGVWRGHRTTRSGTREVPPQLRGAATMFTNNNNKESQACPLFQSSGCSSLLWGSKGESAGLEGGLEGGERV